MKKLLASFSLIVILIIGSLGAYEMASLPRTYDGSKTDAYEISQNYEDSALDTVDDADGVASIIVKQTLKRTHALNAVTAVVFDVRGYDTLGESFILLTAISGAMAILRGSKKGSVEEDAEEN